MSRVRRISYAISKDGRRSTAIQQAIRIRDLALSIVEEANFSAQPTRRVTKKAAFTVVLRSLQQSHDMPFSLREHLAIKELNHYINLAQTNKLNSLTLSHTDLLPISHPRSTREHSMTASGLREANSRWYADDSRITDERARSILASAYSAKFGSVEHTYFTSLLSGLPQGSIPGEALFAILADGNSSAERSLRARLQRRDRFGQFAEMGGGMRALIRMAKDGIVRSLVGHPIADGPDGDDVQVELPNGKIVNIPSSKGEFISAIINPTKDGFSPVPAKVSTEDNNVIINEADLKFVDAPAGWTKLGAITYKNGDWTVTRNEVLNEWEASNTKGDHFQEKTWSDILDKIDAVDLQKAKLPDKKDKKQGFEFKYPDGAYKIAPNVSYDPQGRVDEESSNYTDDPVELAQNQDERDLITALEQAVTTQDGGGAALGNGALAFNKGDEWVPAEAIYLAISEAGGDAEMELAKIYDKNLGGSDNQDALVDFRKKSESVTGETPRLDKAFERIAGKDSGEDVLPATEEPAFDPAEMDKVPLPPLLEGLSEKEISNYQETKDHTPYLPKNEDIAMPVGYKELSPEPYKSWHEVTKDNPEESFPVGWNDNPFYLAQSIDKKSLEAELRRSIEPGNEIPGAALISLPTEDGEDFTAHVPGEAVRDALQLQGVDTNKIIKDIAAEGFIGQKDEAIAQIPEGIDKKGADPIAEGWTSSDWLNEDGSTEFHDLIKANEDFTRLAGFYNDAKIDSPLMSDYQEKDMLGNLGIDATDEINAIDKGLKFEAGPSAKVGYALNLLDNPDFSSNPDFKKDANGERSDTTKIAILKSADENLASAVADLKADSPEVNAINSVRKSIADQIASLETPKEATPDVAPEAPEKDITGYKVVASGADKVDANGTSLQGNISATRKELEAIFGKPDTYEDDKVKVSWSLKFEGPDGTEIATIYDWKNDNALGDDEVYDWHIGGNNPLAVELVKNAFNPLEDIKPIELTPESKYADLVFDGDVSLEDQIKNAIEKGMRIGFFYNGSHRLVTPIDIYTNPKNGNVNVRTKDENGDHRTFTIGNMEDGKDKSDVSLEEQRVLDNNEWVEANAGRLAPILPEDIQEGDYLWSRYYKRYEKVLGKGDYVGGNPPRYKFSVFNPKNNQVETRYYEPKTEIRNVRRIGTGEVPEDFVVPKESNGVGAGPKRGAIKAKPLGERIVAKEGRIMAGNYAKEGFYKDKNGVALKVGDTVIHRRKELQDKYGKGIVKVRVGAQVEEGKKAGGLVRDGKILLDNLMVVWEKDKINHPREYKAGRPMKARFLIKQNEEGAPVKSLAKEEPVRQNPDAVAPEPVKLEGGAIFPEGMELNVENVSSALQAFRLKLPKAKNYKADKNLRDAGKGVDSLLEELNRNKNLDEVRNYYLDAIIRRLNRNGGEQAQGWVSEIESFRKLINDKRDELRIARDAEYKKRMEEPMPKNIWPSEESINEANVKDALQAVLQRIPAPDDFSVTREERSAAHNIKIVVDELVAGFDLNDISLVNLNSAIDYLNRVNKPKELEFASQITKLKENIIAKRLKNPIKPSAGANMPFIDPIAEAEKRSAAGDNLFEASADLRAKFASDDIYDQHQYLQPFKESLQSYFASDGAQPLAKLDTRTRQALSQYISASLRDANEFQGIDVPATEANGKERVALIKALHDEKIAYEPSRTDLGVGTALMDINFDAIVGIWKKLQRDQKAKIIINDQDTGFSVKKIQKGINETFAVTHNDSGQVFFMKREGSTQRADAEIASNLLARALGISGIPYLTRHNTDKQVVISTYAGDNLNLQGSPDNYANSDYIGYGSDSDILKTVNAAAVFDLASFGVLDSVIYNTDRHANNFLVGKIQDNGVQSNGFESIQLLPIDHGFADLLNGVQPNAPEPYTHMEKGRGRTGSELNKALVKSVGVGIYKQLVDMTSLQAIQFLKRERGGDVSNATIDLIISRLETLRGIELVKWDKIAKGGRP